ncbi:hypothetical protein CAEBREN_32770 [Caenorhabditis brenneri]|uniref:Uncharacterized protein n=1 Tax=Caenorhabditis brenneri TaxID=135651 RepID=G0MKQ6_CAEBE|nr:hypothetical protein CAEBREN_32770 [Caenorhabditis brenneri]
MDSDEPGLPIDKLRAVELERVFKHLDLIDIFELSFTSKSIRGSLKEANYIIKSLKVLYQSNMPTIEIQCAKSRFIWTFGYPHDLPMKYAGEYKIGRYTYKCQKSEYGFHTDHYDVEEGFLGVIIHLISIFNFKNTVITELSIDLSVIEDIRTICNHFKKFKKVERLSIHQSFPNEIAATNFNQNFNWIMSNLKIDEIYLGVDGVENVIVQKNGKFVIREVPKRYDEVLNINHICLNYSEWFSSKDLLSLGVKTAILQNSPLTDEDLNSFIKTWLTSNSSKLNWLEVQVSGRYLNENIITKDLSLLPDTHSLMNTCCSCPFRKFDSPTPIPFIFPNNLKQITRSTDSTTATISITHDTFFFHIRDDGPITPPNPTLPPRQLNENDANRRLEERFRLAFRGRRLFQIAVDDEDNVNFF